jgi:lysophospholipase L1-like esterase
MSEDSSANNQVINAILLLGSIAFCVVIGEIAVRLMPTPSHTVSESDKPIIAKTKEFHHDYSPSQTFIRLPNQGDDYEPVQNIISSKGMRGPEVGPKPKEHQRVLLLGDSFIQADEINWNDTVGEKLNQEMADTSIEFLQKGMSSWAPLLELNWLIKEGMSLEPDLVILFLCINDFYNANYSKADAAYTKQAMFSDDGLPIHFDLSKLKSSKKPKKEYSKLNKFLRRSALYRLLVRSIDRSGQPSLEELNFDSNTLNNLLTVPANELEEALAQVIPEHLSTSTPLKALIEVSRPSTLWSAEVHTNVERSFDYISKIQSELKNINAELMVTLVPLGWNYPDENSLGRNHYLLGQTSLPMGGVLTKLDQFAEKQSIKTIDLFGSLKKYKTETQNKVFFQRDGHWNAHGHKAVANTLKPVIKSWLTANNDESSELENLNTAKP